jgi:uncharacterized membrane protein
MAGAVSRARAALARGLDATAASLARIFGALTGWLSWAAIVAAFIGSAIWFGLDRTKRLPFFDNNKVPHEEQIRAVIIVGGSFVALLVAGAIAMGIGRAVEKRWSFLIGMRRVLGVASFAVALPPLMALSKKGIEKGAPKMTLVLCAFAALAAGYAAYRTWRPRQLLSAHDGPLTASEDAEGKRTGVTIALDVLTWLAVLGIWAGYAWFFTKASITNHHALVTRTTDLGYYDNIFWQSIHGRPLGCSFIKAGYHGSAHFDPILVLLSPLYLLYPRAEFLLTLQSVWCGAGAIPAFLIGRHLLKSRVAGVAMAACFALHPALHGANMYEFHSLTMATTPLLFVLHFFQKRAWKSYAAAMVVAMLVREDVPLMLMGVGLVALLHQERGVRRAGLLTILGAMVYFGIVKAFFMTSAGLLMSGKDAYSFAYYYEDLIPNRKGTGGLILSLFTNPVFLLNHAFTEEKALFFFTLFLPVGLLPFFARRDRWMLLYGLLFTLLASRSAVYSTHFQYTAALLAFAFATAPVAVARMADGEAVKALGIDGRRLKAALVVGMVVAAGAVSWKFGGIIQNDAFRGGFYKVARTLSDDQRATHDWIREMAKEIPPNASVGVSNKLGPHVSGRRHAYFYGQKRTEYVFVDEKELKSDRSRAHKKAIEEERLEEIGRKGSMALFRAKSFDKNLTDTEMGEIDVDLDEKQE